MNLIITKSSISELEDAPNIYALLEEYAEESSIDGLPHPSAKVDIYKKLEENGLLGVFAAYHENSLIGFLIVLCSVLPHYGIHVATTESFFVMKDKRNTGAGLKLLRAAENHSREIGSPGILISAPFGGQLAEVLSRGDDYVLTNQVFFRRFV